MQVTHHENFDTHAVIGGNKVREFKIAQTAEFFTVLSSAMYSNKPLAVVREVLCNAWDVHIVTGRHLRPVEVNLSADSLSIRDFGTGIHDDNMEQIYCTYGASTKENDGNQTGGFGLGSKSPFAYTDHFTVTSYFEGKKTVYALSRGSALTEGKPDIRIMVQVPTTESGIEVMIPVKGVTDKMIFEPIIKQIASLGEMNVKYNGSIIQTIPISQAKDNIFLTTDVLPATERSLFIRYGNVVYPIESHEDYKEYYAKIKHTLNNIPDKHNAYDYGYTNNKSNWKLIIQAAPNSISVTPSRESLSMTERTINTIKTLTKNICKILDLGSPEFDAMLMQYEIAINDKIWMQGRPDALLTIQNLTERVDIADTYPNYLFNIEAIAKHYYKYSRSFSDSFKAKRLLRRLDCLIQGKYHRSSNIRLYRDLLNGKIRKTETLFVKESYPYGRHENNTFNKLFLRWLTKHLVKNPNVSVKNMFIANNSSSNRTGYVFTPIQSARPEQKDQLSLLKGVVILANSRISYHDYYTQHPANKFFSKQDSQMVYLVPQKKDALQQAKEFFNKLGYIVVDFASWFETSPHYSIKSVPLVNIPKALRIVKPKGLPALSNLMLNGSINIRSYQKVDHKDFKRIEKPEFIFQPHNLSGSEYDHKFFEFSRDTNEKISKSIINLFGDKGAVVVNAPQYKAWTDKGAVDGYVYLIDKVTNEMLTNPRIQSYLEFQNDEDHANAHIVKALLSMAKYSHVIKSRFHLPDPITDIDRQYMLIYSTIKDNNETRVDRHTTYKTGSWQDKFVNLSTKIKAINESSNYTDIKKSIIRNKMKIASLNLTNCLDVLSNNPDIETKTFIEISIINALSQ